MKVFIVTFLLFVSAQLFSQSTPATKDDMKQMEARIDSKLEMIIHQMDKRFEDVNKRFEDMNTRFEMMNMYFLAIVGAIGVLFLRNESNTKLLLKEISEHKSDIQSQLLDQKQNKIDANQLILVLESLNKKDKQKIREILHI